MFRVLIGAPPLECKMVTSDLVYSPAQVTEHRCVELKDQNISEETKKKFEELKEKYPKVFSCLHSCNNSNNHLLRRAVSKIPSSMDLDIKRKWVHRIVLQVQQTACHKDQPLQHLHIHHKLEDHHGLPQLTIRTWRDVKNVIIINIHPKITRIYWNTMDPLEYLESLVKVQDLLKEKARHQNLILEHHRAQALLDHLKTQ